MKDENQPRIEIIWTRQPYMQSKLLLPFK